MLDRPTLDKTPPRLEVSEDGLISFLYVKALEVGNLFSEPSIIIDRTRDSLPLDNDARLEANPVIVLSKSRSLVHYSRATIVRYVGVGKHPVSNLCLILDKVGKKGFILETLKILALALLLNDIVCLLLEDLRDARLAHDVTSLTLLVLDVDIVECRMNAQSKVAGEGPGRRGPSNKRDGRISANHGESHDALRVRDILVVLPSLKV
mmetsp:Transcript_5473/g.12629  ORF Transcript_5473/g.12629 Transcript_5473/m.12629 type:complete len:207 (+) Transcript_5473:2284-2904(+)